MAPFLRSSADNEDAGGSFLSLVLSLPKKPRDFLSLEDPTGLGVLAELGVLGSPEYTLVWGAGCGIFTG